LSAICEMVGQPKWSSSVMLVLPPWNLSTYWYTFLYTIQFSLYCANIFLWISEGFTTFDHKNWMTARCSTVVQNKSRADMYEQSLCICWDRELLKLYIWSTVLDLPSKKFLNVYLDEIMRALAYLGN
jgi:hypothetical protein